MGHYNIYVSRLLRNLGTLLTKNNNVTKIYLKVITWGKKIGEINEL